MSLTFEGIEKKLITMLNDHLKPLPDHEKDKSRKYNQANKLRGYVLQDPYKSDFFDLFTQAYKAGIIKSSANFRGRVFLQLSYGTKLAKEDLLEIFCRMWDEWLYSWERGIQSEYIQLT